MKDATILFEAVQENLGQQKREFAELYKFPEERIVTNVYDAFIGPRDCLVHKLLLHKFSWDQNKRKRKCANDQDLFKYVFEPITLKKGEGYISLTLEDTLIGYGTKKELKYHLCQLDDLWNITNVDVKYFTFSKH